MPSGEEAASSDPSEEKSRLATGLVWGRCTAARLKDATRVSERGERGTRSESGGVRFVLVEGVGGVGGAEGGCLVPSIATGKKISA